MIRVTSSLAVAALIVGIVGLLIPPIGLVALILGIVAVNQIDRSDGVIGGRGMATAGAIMGGIATFLTVAALVIGIVLPAISHRPRSARPMQNSSQVRGIIQGCLLYAQGNNEYYPGLTSSGGSAIPAVAGNSTYNIFTVQANDQSVANRFAILLNGNYFTPEYMRSPSETLNKTAPASGGAITTGHFSYAMLQISGTAADAGRNSEWKATINPQAAVIGDRGQGGNLRQTSIHVKTTTDPAIRPTDWRGEVGWNDNHVEFLSSAVLPTTKYGSVVNTNDNLFTNDNGSPTVTDGSNALFIYN